MLVNWQTILSGTKRCFLLYSEDQSLSGMRLTLRTLPPRRMFEQILSLDSQVDKTNFDTESKWNIALEEMEKKFGTSCIASGELWIKGGQMIWKELPQQTMVLKELLRHGKEDKGTLTSQ